MTLRGLVKKASTVAALSAWPTYLACRQSPWAIAVPIVIGGLWIAGSYLWESRGRRCRYARQFTDGWAFAFWHHFGEPHGTQIYVCRMKSGLIGARADDGILYLGLWWTIGVELRAVHPDLF